MKTTYKNISIYHYLNEAWSNRKNILLLLVFLLILFSSINLSAQEQRSNSTEERKIAERKTFLSDLRMAEQSARSTYSNAQHIEHLLSKVQPAVYCYSGNIKTYGDKPTCLFTNVQSLNRLNDTTIQKDNIEMATIKIESQSDLSATIDLNLFSDFKNLKYIQIVSTISTTEPIITRMIHNNEGKYSVFFKIQTGDSEQ